MEKIERLTKHKGNKTLRFLLLVTIIANIGISLGGCVTVNNSTNSNDNNNNSTEIIVATASLPESTLKQGYLKSFAGTGGMAWFDPVANFAFMGYGREKDGTPYAVFGGTAQWSADTMRGIHLKLGESAPLY